MLDSFMNTMGPMFFVIILGIVVLIIVFTYRPESEENTPIDVNLQTQNRTEKERAAYNESVLLEFKSNLDGIIKHTIVVTRALAAWRANLDNFRPELNDGTTQLQRRLFDERDGFRCLSITCKIDRLTNMMEVVGIHLERIRIPASPATAESFCQELIEARYKVKAEFQHDIPELNERLCELSVELDAIVESLLPQGVEWSSDWQAE